VVAIPRSGHLPEPREHTEFEFTEDIRGHAERCNTRADYPLDLAGNQ
jgi:hypothetical protein